MKRHSKKILALGVVCLAFLFILSSLFGCATLSTQSVTLKEELKKVEMVVLSEVSYYELEPAGIKVPAIFGDISTTHYYNPIYAEKVVALDFVPRDDSVRPQMVFVLFVKHNCPEAIVLQTYNTETEEPTYWIYDCEGQAYKILEFQ